MKKISIILVSLFIMIAMITSVSAACDISITAPNGGENWAGTHSITWTNNGDPSCSSTSVQSIKFSDDSGTTWQDTAYVGDSLNADANSWSWDTTAITDSTLTRIKITPNGASWTASDADFTVDNTAPVVNVVTGATKLNAADEVTISFTEANNMDETSVKDASHWDIQSPDGSSLTLNNAAFDYDSTTKTLTISLNETTDFAWLKNGNIVCATPTADVTDIAGNPITVAKTCSVAVNGDDTTKPTVSASASPDPAKDGTVTVTLLFSESMDNNGNNPTIGFSGNTGSFSSNSDGAWSTTTNFQDTWTESYTLTDGNARNTVTIAVTNSPEDLPGNTLSDNSAAGTFVEDSEEPTVISVDSDGETYYDGTSSPVTTKITFSEAMSLKPTVSVSGDGAQTVDDCADGDDTTFCFDYTIPDGVDTTKTITITSAKDEAGNTMTSDATHTFDVDTENPTGTLSVTVDPMYEDALTQTVTITYDEAMDTAVANKPSISFDEGTFTTNNDGSWNPAGTIWTESFVLTDNNEEFSTVTVTSSGAKDLAGNVEGTSVDDTFAIDTLQPTITDFSDTNFLFTDRGNTVTVYVDFSETMDSTIPTVLESGTTPAGWTINNIAWSNTTRLHFDYVVPNSDVGLLSDSSWTISLAKDANGNVMDAHVEATTIDTDKPGKTSIGRSYDPMYEGQLSQTINLFYDEAMNQTSTPTISFDAGTFTSTGGSWVSATQWREFFTLADNNETIATVTVTSSGATDVSGNVEETTGSAIFAIDTVQPTVTSLTVDTNPISDSDTGNTFTVTIDYSENMDSTVIPTIVFTPNIDSTLTACSGSNVDADTFTYVCTIADANVEVADVDVTVSSAKDVAGNVQVAYTAVDKFDVDTLNPTVVSAIATPNPANDGTVNIIVTFDEAMAATPAPVVDVLGLTSTYNGLSGNWIDSTTWNASFTLQDDDEETTATISVTGNPTDVVGNLMVDNVTAGTFDVDTITPETSAVEVSPTPVRSGSQFTVTANVIENNFDEAIAYIYNSSNNIVANVSTGTLDDNGLVSFIFTGTFDVGTYRVVVLSEDTATNLEIEDENNRETFQIIAPLEGDPIITSFSLNKTTNVEPGEIIEANCTATFENSNNSYYEINGIYDADGVMNIVAEMNDGTYTVTCKAVDGVNSRFVTTSATYTVGAVASQTGADLVTYIATFGTTSINNVKVALDWLYDNFDNYYTKTASDARYYTQTQIDNLFGNYYTKTDLDNGQLDNRYYTESEVDSAITNDGDYDSLSDLQSSVSNDYHNLGGTDADTTYTNGTGLLLTGTTFGLDTVYTNSLYYLKTQIDTQSKVESIWGVTLATDAELTSAISTEQTDRISNDSKIRADFTASDLALNGRIDSVNNTLTANATAQQSQINDLENRALKNTDGWDVYFTQGWNEFELPWFVLKGNANVNGLNVANYSVETILGSTGYSYLAYYDGSAWQTYVPGDVGATTFTEFPSDATDMDYTYHLFVNSTSGIRRSIGTN